MNKNNYRLVVRRVRDRLVAVDEIVTAARQAATLRQIASAALAMLGVLPSWLGAQIVPGGLNAPSVTGANDRWHSGLRLRSVATGDRQPGEQPCGCRIAVIGGGFINTARAILRTGTPSFAPRDSLAGFTVKGGHISFQAQDSMRAIPIGSACSRAQNSRRRDLREEPEVRTVCERNRFAGRPIPYRYLDYPCA
jgi:Extended Signal Peptide of Type V secretion system